LETFNVVAEFQFHAADAILQSKALGGQLEKVASLADQVNEGLRGAAASLLGQVGLYGGIAGAIYSAVKAADKYEQTQRSIANIFLSNKMFEGPDSFTEAMNQSSKAMENMKNTAREFSLPVGDFVSTAKMIGAGLVNHGLDDSSMSKTTMLTRGYLKSAPMLGVDPGMAQGELMDMVNGRAHMSARLAQRLVNETAAMRPYAGGGAGGPGSRVNSGLTKFNNLTPEKRLETLTTALMQFGSNAKIVEENAKSLSGQMQRLTDNVTGMFSILRPLGEAFLQPIKNGLLQFNKWLESNGEATAKSLARMISGALSDPQALFASIQQLRSLRSDSHKAGQVIEIEAILAGLTFGLRLLGVEMRGGLIATGIRWLWGALTSLGRAFVGLGGLTVLTSFFTFLVTEAIPQFALFTSVFQGISRGFGMAEILNAKWIAANMPRIMEAIASLKNAFTLLLAPLEMVTTGIANITSEMLSHEILWESLLTFIETFAHVIEGLGNIIVALIAGISASMRILMTIADAWTARDFKKMYGIFDQMKDGYNIVWDKFHPNATQNIDNSQIGKTAINIDNVNINNQFKEQMEPDRVAFALVDQLKRAAVNQTQGASSMGARAVR
jgi:hypothetical protein